MAFGLSTVIIFFLTCVLARGTYFHASTLGIELSEDYCRFLPLLTQTPETPTFILYKNNVRNPPDPPANRESVSVISTPFHASDLGTIISIELGRVVCIMSCERTSMDGFPFGGRSDSHHEYKVSIVRDTTLLTFATGV